MLEGFEKVTCDISGALRSAREKYLDIDIQMLDTSSAILDKYIEQQECKIDVPVVVPPELQAVISMLDKMSTDLQILKDVIFDSELQLNMSAGIKSK